MSPIEIFAICAAYALLRGVGYYGPLMGGNGLVGSFRSGRGGGGGAGGSGGGGGFFGGAGRVGGAAAGAHSVRAENRSEPGWLRRTWQQRRDAFRGGWDEGRQVGRERQEDREAQRAHWRNAVEDHPEHRHTGWKGPLLNHIERVHTCPQCGHGSEAAPSRNFCNCPRGDCACGPYGEEPREPGEPKRMPADDEDAASVESRWLVTMPDGRRVVSTTPTAYEGREGYTVEPVSGIVRRGGFEIVDQPDGQGSAVGDPAGDKIRPDPSRDNDPDVAAPYQIIDPSTNGSTNGGPVMTAPTTTTNGARTNGEASTFDGARAAWGSFGGFAAEQMDSASAVEQEAQARMTSAATMLEAATAAETDARQQIAAAQTLAASMADGDMGDPQAIADAESQQEHAASLASAAAAMAAEAESAMTSAQHQLQLAQQVKVCAETSQAHCTSSLAGMNQRMSRRESFFKG